MRKKDECICSYILKVIIEKKEISQKDIGEVFGVTERTIRRYFKILKEKNIIELKRIGNRRKWKVK